jgi:hypothetical protein
MRLNLKLVNEELGRRGYDAELAKGAVISSFGRVKRTSGLTAQWRFERSTL